jgi:hypothetical protein
MFQVTMKPLRKEDLERVNLLDIAPVRLTESEEEKGRLVIIRPKPKRRGVTALLHWVQYWMAVPRIRLDDRGAFVWGLLDGRRTVGEIAQLARERFGDAIEPAEERVGRLMLMFRREDLVAYPGVDEVEIR